MDISASLGLIGGIAGSLIGLLGAVVGTYFSLRRAKTSAERHLIWWSVLWVSLLVGAFLASQFLLPVAWRWVGATLYGLALAWFIIHGIQRQSAHGKLDRNA